MEVVEHKEGAARRVRGRDVEAQAPSMPLKLIAPVLTEANTGSIATSSGDTAIPSSDAKRAWGITAVGADKSPLHGTGVVVAVLDTGITAVNAKGERHQAFKDVNLIERDFTGEGNGDATGHGTHCAGTIFGRDVDGVRIGIARGVTTALIGKVIGKDSGASEHVVDAIYWALDRGANVISLSLGLNFPGYQAWLQNEKGLKPEPATSKALEAYRLNIRLFDKLATLVATLAQVRQPCLLIAATGNESARDDVPAFAIGASPPAVSEGFIAVGALQPGDTGLTVAPFSNTGPALSAPGVGILSAHPGGGLIRQSGTSMATPHVAGIAALWAERLKAGRDGLRLKSFETTLLHSATMKGLDPKMTADDVGAGIVQAPE